MSISPTTGAITGTPADVSNSSSITIEATNSAGSDSTTISINVRDEAPSINYSGSPFTFINNTIIVDITPQNSGGESDNWSQRDGNLPVGLVLNATTGIISGTPLFAPTDANITIVASNAAGSDFFPLRFIIIQADDTVQDSEDKDDNVIFEYIRSEPVVLFAGVSVFILICCVLAALLIGYASRVLTEKDLTEDEKSKLASRYNKLFRDENPNLIPGWDKIGRPRQVLFELDTKLTELSSIMIPESEHLEKAKRNFMVMKSELKTPAAATPYLRSILTSILRAYREHLRMVLANSGHKGKMSPKDGLPGSKILENLRTGLNLKPGSKNAYNQMKKNGLIGEEIVNLIPELQVLMDRLNKAIHLEDTGTKILEEPDFIKAISLLNQLLDCGFKDL